MLGTGGEEIAIQMPIETAGRRGKRRLSRADYDAVMSAAGSWQGHLDDPEEFKRQIDEARGSNRPFVRLTLPEE